MSAELHITLTDEGVQALRTLNEHVQALTTLLGPFAGLLEQPADGAEPANAQGAAAARGESDCWIRGAKRIAEYIDAKPSRVYALSSAKRIPVEHDGRPLVARKSDLDAWLRAGGGKRP